MKELQPLAEISSRREAVERCIAPLSALAVVNWCDTTQDFFGDIPSDLNGKRVLEDGASLLARMFDSSDALAPIHVTAEQHTLFESYTYARRYIKGGLQDTIENQNEVLGAIVVPGCIAAQDSLQSVEDAITAKFDASAQRIHSILTNPDIIAGLRTMSFGPNGTYEFAERLSPYDVFKTAQSHLRSHTPEDSELLQPLRVTELFVSRGERLVFSPRGVKILRAFLRLDNHKSVRNNGEPWQGSPTRVQQSRGCPASIKTVPMRSDDLSSAQWDLMTRREQPVGRYNSDDQTFTLLRSPIAEYNRLLARVIYHPASAIANS